MLKELRQYFRIKKYNNVKVKDAKINKNTIFEGNNSIEKRSFISDCYLGEYSYVGEDCKLRNVKIGRYCSLGNNIKVIFGNHPTNFVGTHPIFYEENDNFNPAKKVQNTKWDVVIENDVWIGDNVSIFPGVTIKNGAIIGTNALVTKDVEEFSIVVGVPAKIIKYRFDKETVNEIKETKWWLKSKDELKVYKKYFHLPKEFVKNLNKNLLQNKRG